MENSKTIHLETFKDALSRVAAPLDKKVHESLVTLLRADSKCVGEAYRQQKFQEYAKAEQEEKRLGTRMESSREGIERIERLIADLTPGSWTMGVVSLVCFVVCFAAEYVFNSAVMPWLVSVSSTSLLGMALSMAPATAPVILDRVIVALFDVHGSWQAIKSTLLTSFNLRMQRILRVAFLALVGLLNLSAVWLLADARGVASYLQNNSEAISVSAEQQRKINVALLLVSIAVTTDGALFYLFGLYELHKASRSRKADAQLDAVRSTHNELVVQQTAAKADLADKQKTWSEIDKLQQSITDAYFASGIVSLDELASRPAPAQTARERVLQILTRVPAIGPSPGEA